MTTRSASTLAQMLVSSALAAALAAPASALLSAVETLRDVPVRVPRDFVVSGDDHFLYVLGDSALAVFERDAATGFVTFVAAYLQGYDVDGIFRASSMVLSPDDRFLYVASPQHLDDDDRVRGAIAIFERSAADGSLSLVDVETRGFGAFHEGAGDVRLTMTSDGADLYAASARDSAVLVFRRQPADGSLSYLGATSESIDPRSYMLVPVLSGDERFLYLTQARFTDTLYGRGIVGVYARDTASGALTFVEEHVNHAGGVEDMDFPDGAIVSPDDAHLYVMNSVDFPYDVDEGALVAFRRDPTTGRLTYIGPQDYPASPADAAWSDDGSRLYVAGVGGGTTSLLSEMVIYARDQATGALQRITAIREDRDVFFGEPSPLLAVAFAADRKHLYAGTFNGRLVSVWEILQDGGLRLLDDPADPTGGRGALRGVVRAAVSPDGRHVYAVSDYGLGLTIYERDAATGELAFAAFVAGTVDQQIGPLAVSADGRWVYALSSVFARDAESGLLEAVPQPDFEVDLYGDDVVPSADGRHLYVLRDSPESPIVGYAQAAAGRLRPLELSVPPVPGRGRLRGARAAAVSADGAYLYAVGYFEGAPRLDDEIDAVWAFARDAASGHLTLEAYAVIGPSVFDDRRLAVAPDGRHVYLVQARADDLLVFEHDRETKRLRLVERHANGVGGVDGLDEPRDVALSPSGGLVYVAGRLSDAVAVFARDPGSGRLSFLAAARGGPAADDLLVRPEALAAAPGGQLYAVSPRRSALSVLALDCEDDDGVHCLAGERFRADVVWRDGHGTGAGRRVPLRSASSGLFWFFDADNWEMLLKVLDGCRINGRFWVFAAATTDVGYDLRVVDTLTGGARVYVNPLGTASPAITDTGALGSCDADASSGTGTELVSGPGPATALEQGECAAGPDELCLRGERFRVEVEWRDGHGQSGKARAVPFAGSDDSGLLWFFSPDNWEMLLKVLDGCRINNHFWVFAAATTDVGYTLRVTDVETGAVREYVNPLGVASPAVTDTGAFVCP